MNSVSQDEDTPDIRSGACEINARRHERRARSAPPPDPHTSMLITWQTSLLRKNVRLFRTDVSPAGRHPHNIDAQGRRGAAVLGDVAMCVYFARTGSTCCSVSVCPSGIASGDEPRPVGPRHRRRPAESRKAT